MQRTCHKEVIVPVQQLDVHKEERKARDQEAGQAQQGVQ